MTQLVNPDDNSKGFPQTGTMSGSRASADVYIAGGGHEGPQGNSGTGLSVAVGAASTASAAITATLIDIVATTECFIQIAASPVAVVNDDYYVPKNTTYRFPITSGNKVAVIQSAAAGTLYIHPVT